MTRPATSAQSSQSAAVERCLRCSAVMEWRHQSWQCPTCGLKLGCCEGESCER